MNILLINHYAGSIRHGMEYRPFYLAREWVRMGHRVDIIAASYAHVRTVQPEVHGAVTREVVEDVHYTWLKTPAYSGNGIGRVRNMLSFTGQLTRYSGDLAQLHRPDVVIASSTYPLDNYPAKRIARAAGARLVYEVHDLWPLSPMELGEMSPRHPFIMLMQWAENFAYKNCDRVISMLPCARSHMMEHGLEPGKFHHVPNGIDVEEWCQNHIDIPAEHKQALDRLRVGGRFLVCYAGAHGPANALDRLLEAAELLRGSQVHFVLVGQGPEKDNLIRLAEGLDNVEFLPPVPKACIPDLLERMDALYIGLAHTPLFRFGISPNKLMDYMMAAKPIIQSIDAGNDLVRDSGCGISVSSEHPQAIADAILSLVNTNPSEREAMGKRGREYVLEHHDYAVLAKRFLEALEMGSTTVAAAKQPINL